VPPRSAQLLAEGYKVCDASAKVMTLAQMVASDVGVSTSAGNVLAEVAKDGLGC
jgi:hypothetical protein